MADLYGTVKNALFRLDPETAHELAVWSLQRLGGLPPLLSALERRYFPRVAPVSRWGLEFPSKVGLAAGFDKNAEMIEALSVFGFGFIEAGTVTLHPQKGNPKPRLFRYPAERALINRMGFNNDGALVVAGRLRRLAQRRRTQSGPRGPLFVNIGKNREVEPQEAPRAYAACYEIVGPWADGAVVNVSSPNTPNLRDLQRPDHLREILLAMRDARKRMSFAGPGEHPILVKIAPDLHPEELGGIARVCRELADGMVATNTTLDHRSIPAGIDQQGGLSGAPLFEASTAILADLRRLLGESYPLVGVGGIDSVEAARAKLDAGADLIQIYTGFIYGGPGFARLLGEGIA
jgi:dihydroorotate dehydrogenase